MPEQNPDRVYDINIMLILVLDDANVVLCVCVFAVGGVAGVQNDDPRLPASPLHRPRRATAAAGTSCSGTFSTTRCSSARGGGGGGVERGVSARRSPGWFRV